MANENVEGSSAKAMAGSDKYTAGLLKNWSFANIISGGNRGGSGGDGGAGGSGGRSGNGKTGNGWTAEDYKNYGDWQERHYGLHDESQDRKTYREGKALEHRTDMQTVRNNEDLLTDVNRQRASRAISGYGAGNQGGSRQQTRPGGRAAGTTGSVGAPKTRLTNADLTTTTVKPRGKKA